MHIQNFNNAIVKIFYYYIVHGFDVYSLSMTIVYARDHQRIIFCSHIPGGGGGGGDLEPSSIGRFCW